MKLIVYHFRQSPTDAVDTAQILDSRRGNALQAAKVGQQIAPPRRADTRHILQG